MSLPVFIFCLGAIAAYVIYSDPNVSQYVDIQIKLLGINIRRWWLMIQLHPRNPLTKWTFERKMKAMVKQIQEENDITKSK